MKVNCSNQPDNLPCCTICQKPRCKACLLMQTICRVARTQFDYFHNITSSSDYATDKVVYLIQGKACLVTYIGKTATVFWLRFNNRKAHTKTMPSLPLPRHVSLTGHSITSCFYAFWKPVSIIRQIRKLVSYS